MVDVVVIGGGAMGSAATWQLATRGADVVLLERFAAGHTRGASHGASRIFRLTYGERVYVELARQAPRTVAAAGGPVRHDPADHHRRGQPRQARRPDAARRRPRRGR